MNSDYLFIPIGLFIPAVVLFKRELLIEKPTVLILTVVSAVLFILGLALHFTDVGRFSSSGALLTPLMSLGFYRLSRRIFVKHIRHEPRDTYMNWSPGMAADRLFNIVFFMGCWLLAMLNAIGMEELAKRGW